MAATLVVAASAHVAQAQISPVGATISAAFTPTVRGTDVAFDTVNQQYLMVGASDSGSIRAVFLNTSGNVVNTYLIFAGGGNTGQWAQFPRVEYARQANGGKGAFLVAWHSLGRILVSMVSATDGVLTSAEVISGTSTWEEIGPSIAYSSTSQTFLLVWQTARFGIEGRFVGVSGSPVGPVRTFANEFTARDPSVAWHPTTNQFGFGYSGFGGSGAYVRFRLVDMDGTLSGGHTTGNTSVGTYNTDLAVNTLNGSYVFVWAQPAGHGSYFLELSSAGAPLNEGLISTQMGDTTSLSLDYSPMSGTFLAVGQSAQSYNASAAELSPRGVPLTAATVVTDGGEVIGTYYPRVTARLDGAPHWMMSFSRKFNEMAGQIVSTTSNYACTYTLSASSATVGGGGGSATGTLTASSSSCSWTSSSNASWLSVAASSGSGATSYSLTVTATANRTREERTGVLTIAGRTFTVTQRRASSVADTNNDGFSDLIWRNVSDGGLAVWTMNGKNLIDSYMMSHSVPDQNWKIEATMDHDADGDVDLIWRHQTTGDLAVWVMNGRTLVDSQALSPGRVTDTDWKIVGSGDFNGDGKPDLFWQNSATGGLAIWYMNGRTLIDSVMASHSSADLNWKVVAVDDMDNDGDADLIWRHSGTGEMAVWFMNGKTLVDSYNLSTRFVTDLNWKVVGSGDFDGDGNVDLIWQHDGNGDIAVWYMNGRTLINSAALNPGRVTDLNWKIVGPR